MSICRAKIKTNNEKKIESKNTLEAMHLNREELTSHQPHQKLMSGLLGYWNQLILAIKHSYKLLLPCRSNLWVQTISC